MFGTTGQPGLLSVSACVGASIRPTRTAPWQCEWARCNISDGRCSVRYACRLKDNPSASYWLLIVWETVRYSSRMGALLRLDLSYGQDHIPRFSRCPNRHVYVLHWKRESPINAFYHLDSLRSTIPLQNNHFDAVILRFPSMTFDSKLHHLMVECVQVLCPEGCL